jgi:hypothetical protein
MSVPNRVLLSRKQFCAILKNAQEVVFHGQEYEYECCHVNEEKAIEEFDKLARENKHV